MCNAVMRRPLSTSLVDTLSVQSYSRHVCPHLCLEVVGFFQVIHGSSLIIYLTQAAFSLVSVETGHPQLLSPLN